MTNGFGGQSMVGPLRRVMVCDPLGAGWMMPERTARWQELAYLRAPDFELAQKQHAAMQSVLMHENVETLLIPEGEELTLDAVYAHDVSLTTDRGVILLRMGKPARAGEVAHQRMMLEAFDVPVLGELVAPATAEAGDIVWLDAGTLLISRSDRTNDAGIEQLRSILKPLGVELIAASLPADTGFACLHLMSLISLLNEKTVLADLDLLPQQSASLLQSRGFQLIKIESTERATLACNVLSLGGNRLLALDENPRTNTRLRESGFDVKTFSGSELCINGGGGPTCLTRPVLRTT